MKHYKDPATNEVYAYEADGSQDAYIKEGLVAITDAEAEQILAQQQQEQLAAAIASNPSPTDAPTKLAQFLAANPDVLALIQNP